MGNWMCFGCQPHHKVVRLFNTYIVDKILFNQYQKTSRCPFGVFMSPLPRKVPGIVTGNINYKMFVLHCFQQHDYIVILNKCVNVWISQLISDAVDVPRQYANVCGRRHTYFIHFVDLAIYNEILGQYSVLFSDNFDHLLCGISKFNFSCCREV